MEARRSLERAEAIEGGPLHVLDAFARRAAIMIAVLAGLLAVSTLLSGAAVKESINSQTSAALNRSVAETNGIKAFVGTTTARELGLMAGAQTNRRQAQALRHAARLDDQVARSFAPRERVLLRRAAAMQEERTRSDPNDADAQALLADIRASLGKALARTGGSRGLTP